MFRGIGRIIGLSLMVAAGAAGLLVYQWHFAQSRELHRLQEQKRQLEQVVQRLSAERRVAEVLVSDQKTIGGTLQTTLLWVEYDAAGRALPAKSFTIEGNQAHFDALVIKFERDFVAKDDPLRGHSIVLFQRVFGEKQKPENGFRIDEPGKVPDVYRGSEAQISEFETELWRNFWKLAQDESYRQEKGVRVAQGESPWGPFEPGRLYRVSIEAAGGLNIISEPLRGIYREALKGKE